VLTSLFLLVFRLCVFERKKRDAATCRMLGVVQNMFSMLGECFTVDIVQVTAQQRLRAFVP
jgi:hypothetical protein